MQEMVDTRQTRSASGTMTGNELTSVQVGPWRLTASTEMRAAVGLTLVNRSRVSLTRWDLERFPLLQNTTPHQALLQEGQCVYVPAGWLHGVSSFPEHGSPQAGSSGVSGSHVNMAVAYWFVA